MSMRYKGGVISATPPTVTSSIASGAFTLSQQFQYVAAGTWPFASGPAIVIQIFTTSGSWTAPAGVTSVDYLVVAGGGGGGGGGNDVVGLVFAS